MLIVLDNSNPAPLYQQIVDQVRAKVLAGEIQPGTQLPSIRQLAADLLTSVITTKRAYQELEAAGLIQTRP
ncbi:MAG TPA: GntR family transcriptional regulator, partial [Clostridiales bacterium]|nr:GntR family transcriptional regulator [Clostridiales bacterium]